LNKRGLKTKKSAQAQEEMKMIIRNATTEELRSFLDLLTKGRMLVKKKSEEKIGTVFTKMEFEIGNPFLNEDGSEKTILFLPGHVVIKEGAKLFENSMPEFSPFFEHGNGEISVFCGTGCQIKFIIFNVHKDTEEEACQMLNAKILWLVKTSILYPQPED